MEISDDKTSPVMHNQKPITIAYPFVGDIEVGGGHVTILVRIRNLDHKRFRPLIVVHGASDGPVTAWLRDRCREFEQVPVPTYYRGGRRNSLRDVVYLLSSPFALARLLRAREVRIVHVSEPRMLATWALPARLAGAKLIWGVGGVALKQWFSPLRFWAADQTVVVSAFAAGRRAGAKKCTIIPPPFEAAPSGVDRTSCRRRLLEELDQPPDARIIGFFASLRSHARAQKRPQTFLEAISALRSRAPELSLIGAFFGNVPRQFERELRARAEELGIQDRVRFMGFRYPPEPWLAACDVMLAPAVDEGFGRTVVEAMLVGTPVVAAASGAYPEIIDDMSTGLLVEPDRPAVHAEKLQMLLRDGALRQRLTAQAREAAMARFAANVHVSAVMDLYERLLGLKQPRQEPAGSNSGSRGTRSRSRTR
jgi:glycosyltransferase involved in cell wall biosynthesis